MNLTSSHAADGGTAPRPIPGLVQAWNISRRKLPVGLREVAVVSWLLIAPDVALYPSALLGFALLLLPFSSASQVSISPRAFLPLLLFLLLPSGLLLSWPRIWWTGMVPWLLFAAVLVLGPWKPEYPKNQVITGASRPELWAGLSVAASIIHFAGLMQDGFPAVLLASIAWLRSGPNRSAIQFVAWAFLLLSPVVHGTLSPSLVLMGMLSALLAGAQALRATAHRPGRRVLALGQWTPLLVVAGHLVLLGILDPRIFSDDSAIRALQQLDGWWRVQVAGLQDLAAHPWLGPGVYSVSFLGDQALSSLSPPAELSPATLFLLDHGWIGYGLMALFLRSIWPVQRRASLWVVLGSLAVAPSQQTATLRLLPWLALLLAASGQCQQRGGLSIQNRAPRLPGPMAKAAAWTVATLLFIIGVKSLASELYIAAGDDLARHLQWPRAVDRYQGATELAFWPEKALHRLSDLELRWARIARDRGVLRAERPLLEILTRGSTDAWTLYRLAEISRYRGRPQRASSLFAWAERLQPQSALIRIAAGHNWLDLRRQDLAAKEFRIAVGIRPSLLPRLFHALRRISINPALLGQLILDASLEDQVIYAELLAGSGLVAPALVEFEKLTANPSPPSWVLLRYARMLAGRNRVSLALEILHGLGQRPTIGPREKLDIFQELLAFEPSPKARARAALEIVRLLPYRDLNVAVLSKLALPILISGLPEEAHALVKKAIHRLEASGHLRKSLAANRRIDELRELARKWQTGGPPQVPAP